MIIAIIICPQTVIITSSAEPRRGKSKILAVKKITPNVPPPTQIYQGFEAIISEDIGHDFCVNKQTISKTVVPTIKETHEAKNGDFVYVLSRVLMAV